MLWRKKQSNAGKMLMIRNFNLATLIGIETVVECLKNDQKIMKETAEKEVNSILSLLEYPVMNPKLVDESNALLRNYYALRWKDDRLVEIGALKKGCGEEESHPIIINKKNY